MCFSVLKCCASINSQKVTVFWLFYNPSFVLFIKMWCLLIFSLVFLELTKSYHDSKTFYSCLQKRNAHNYYNLTINLDTVHAMSICTIASITIWHITAFASKLKWIWPYKNIRLHIFYYDCHINKIFRCRRQ